MSESNHYGAGTATRTWWTSTGRRTAPQRRWGTCYATATCAARPPQPAATMAASGEPMSFSRRARLCPPNTNTTQPYCSSQKQHSCELRPLLSPARTTQRRCRLCPTKLCRAVGTESSPGAVSGFWRDSSILRFLNSAFPFPRFPRRRAGSWGRLSSSAPLSRPCRGWARGAGSRTPCEVRTLSGPF